jgi:hypothetical protein
LLYPFPLFVADNYFTFPSNNFLPLFSWIYIFPLSIANIYPILFYHSLLLALN